MRPDKQLPLAEAFSKALADYKPISLRHADILGLWSEHPSKADLWLSLGRAAAKHGKSPPRPMDFIDFVLSCTMPAARLNDHSQAALNSFEKLKLKILKVVEDADYPLGLWRDLQRFEVLLRELDQSDYDMYAAAGGPKDQNGSRDRKLFAQKLFRYLRDSCGEELVTEVSVMLDIIYPTHTDERQARRWLSEISPKSPSRIIRERFLLANSPANLA